jgi:hypothetical protein
MARQQVLFQENHSAHGRSLLFAPKQAAIAAKAILSGNRMKGKEPRQGEALPSPLQLARYQIKD